MPFAHYMATHFGRGVNYSVAPAVHLVLISLGVGYALSFNGMLGEYIVFFFDLIPDAMSVILLRYH